MGSYRNVALLQDAGEAVSFSAFAGEPEAVTPRMQRVERAFDLELELGWITLVMENALSHAGQLR